MYFDVYIQKKDKSLPAHKAIMSLNTVFTEIMKSTAENESVICLDKYDSADVEILLFYIHTDQVLTEAASISLLQLASKFQQTNLASLCTNALEADGRIYGDQVLEFAGEFIHHDISNPHTRPPTSRLLVHLASFPLSAPLWISSFFLPLHFWNAIYVYPSARITITTSTKARTHCIKKFMTDPGEDRPKMFWNFELAFPGPREVQALSKFYTEMAESAQALKREKQRQEINQADINQQDFGNRMSTINRELGRAWYKCRKCLPNRKW